MRFSMPLVLALALAACDRSETPPTPEVSANDVAAQLAQVEIEPGQWQATTEIVSAEGPLPQAVIRQMVGRRTNASNCITPEQAKRPDASFLSAQQNSQCTYHEFSMQGGKLRGRMTCTSPDMPAEMETVMNGDYGPRAYDMTLNMSPTLPGGGAMKITARTRGERVGACT